MAAGLIVRAVRRAAARRATACGDERRDDWRPFGETEFVAVEERPSPAEDTPLLVVPRFVDPRPAESEVLELPLLCDPPPDGDGADTLGPAGDTLGPVTLGEVMLGVVTLGDVTDGVEPAGVVTLGTVTDGVVTLGTVRRRD